MSTVSIDLAFPLRLQLGVKGTKRAGEFASAPGSQPPAADFTALVEKRYPKSPATSRPTTSPRLFSTGTSSRVVTLRTAPAAGASAREAPSSHLSAKLTPSRKPTQRTPSAPPLA